MSKTVTSGALKRAVCNLSFGAFLFASAPLFLAEPVSAKWAERLTCTFDKGSSGSYAGGEFTSAPPSTLSFDVSAIDLEKQAAVLHLKPGKPPGQLRVVRAINANHFIEVVTEGFLNLTTIYDPDPVTGRHPAVHSRHFGVLGQPVFAQYTGTCRAG